MKNIRIFYLKNCHFLVVKFSVYLNRRVFVMIFVYNSVMLHLDFTNDDVWMADISLICGIYIECFRFQMQFPTFG